MSKIITSKQLFFAIVTLCLSPIYRNIPKILCEKSGNAGFLSIIFGLVLTLLLCYIIHTLVKNFPAQNIYGIIKTLTNTFVAKAFSVITLFWAIANIIYSLHFNVITVQGTISPYTTDSFLFGVLLLLTAYCLYSGIKTAMRISELVLIILLAVLGGLLIISFQNFDGMNLLPITFSDTGSVIKSAPYSACIFGFIFIYLFYADKLDRPQISFKPYIYFSLTVFIVATLVTVITIGVQGADLASTYTLPFFSVIKRTSLLNIFERMEAFLILPSIVSDFIYITFFMSIIILSIKWIFSLEKTKLVAVPCFIGVFIIASLVANSQFSIESFYYDYLVWVNSIYEYVIPLLFFIIYLIRRKKLKAEK